MDKKYGEEREISLLDLTFSVLCKWRYIVVSMLIGAVVLGTFSYISSQRAAQIQKAKVTDLLQENEEKDKETDKKIKDSLDKLKEEDYIAFNNIQNYRKVYDDKVAYYDNALWMKIDPNHVQRSTITFMIKNDVYVGRNAANTYEILIGSGQMVNYVAENVQKVQTETLRDVISTNILPGNARVLLENEEKVIDQSILKIQINHYDKEICKKIAQAIVGYVEEQQNFVLDKCGNHELVLLDNFFEVVADDTFLDKQKMAFTEMAGSFANYNNLILALTEEQKEYYDLTNGEEELESSAGTSYDSPTVTEHIPAARLSIKYVILGMVLGAILCIFIFFLRYIMNSKLRETDDLQQIYHFPQLGKISADRKTNKPFGFVDNWVISLRDKNKRTFSFKEAQELARVAIKMAAKQEKLLELYFVGCDLKDDSMSICQTMQEILKVDGIAVNIINNPIYNAEEMQKLENAEAVVLFETAESTLYGEISQEIALFKRLNIKVLGGIIVSKGQY